MSVRNWMVAIFCMLALGIAVPSPAATIYGDSASSGNNPIHTIDLATGNETARFTGQASGNGRGMVVVGDVIYYTVVSDPNIYKMDRATGAPLGSILTTNASMSTIAWDGSTFWTTDYSGTNKGYQIDPTTGANINTVTFANATRYMDGMEYFNGKLIVNRTDGYDQTASIYDVYDLGGNLLQANFITSRYGTGIAFDGTDFYVSNVNESQINIFDGTTGLFKSTLDLTSSFGGFLIEDLSVDYAQRSDTGGQVPEPGTMLLLGSGLVGLAAWRRKK